MKWLEHEPENQAPLVDLDHDMVPQSVSESERLKKQQRPTTGALVAENTPSEKRV